MTTRTFHISEAQPQLAELLELALGGTDVTIVAGDKTLARLVPVASRTGKRLAASISRPSRSARTSTIRILTSSDSDRHQRVVGHAHRYLVDERTGPTFAVSARTL